MEVPFQPFQKRRLEDAPPSIERVARQPDQLGLMEAQLSGFFQLFAQLLNVDDVTQTHRARTIEQSERGLGRAKMLPDELEHQQLVEIRIQQRTRDRVQFPVMVVRTPGNVNNHSDPNLPQRPSIRSAQTRSTTRG